MALFGSKEAHFLGVDLSPDAIKIVELKSSKGKPQLVTYGYSETKTDVLRGDFIENKNITSTLLKEVCNKANCSAKVAVAALPISNVFSTVVKVPKLQKRDLQDRTKLKQIISEQVRHILPMPIDEMLFDFNLLQNNGQQKESKGVVDGAKFLITASAKTLVKKYVDIFKQAGLQLSNLDIEPFALVRSLVGNDKSLILLADFGENNTSLSIIDNGIPVLNRGLNIGSGVVTQALSDQMGISIEDAEQYKYDLGVMATQGSLQQLPQPVLSGLGPIVAEMKYILKTFYQQMGNSRKVEKVIITGGGATLAKLSEHLKQELDINTYVGDPWARIIYPQELQPVLQEVGPRFSVAIGLAMRDIIQ